MNNPLKCQYIAILNSSKETTFINPIIYHIKKRSSPLQKVTAIANPSLYCNTSSRPI